MYERRTPSTRNLGQDTVEYEVYCIIKPHPLAPMGSWLIPSGVSICLSVRCSLYTGSQRPSYTGDTEALPPSELR